MRFEMRTVVRSLSTLAMLLALVFVAGSAARAQGRHDLRYRHDNGLHRGWYMGQHRGWNRNNNDAYRRDVLRNRLRYERRGFRREERLERRTFRRSDYDALLIENPDSRRWRSLAEKLNWAASPKYSETP